MSPLVSAPNRGYADYQRQSNWDTGVLWNEDTGPIAADVTSPVIDMSRSAFVGMNIAALTGQPLIILNWYLDAGATLPVGRRQFQMTQSIANNAQVRMLNMGPFLQITLSRVTVPNYRVIMQVYGTSRTYPLEFIPRSSLLIDVQGQAIGASPANVTTYPIDYYAGPVRVAVFGLSSGFITLDYLNGSGVLDPIDQQSMNASGDTVFNTVVPVGAWAVNVQNGSTATSYDLIVTPSFTGAT